MEIADDKELVNLIARVVPQDQTSDEYFALLWLMAMVLGMSERSVGNYCERAFSKNRHEIANDLANVLSGDRIVPISCIQAKLDEMLDAGLRVSWEIREPPESGE